MHDQAGEPAMRACNVAALRLVRHVRGAKCLLNTCREGGAVAGRARKGSEKQEYYVPGRKGCGWPGT